MEWEIEETKKDENAEHCPIAKGKDVSINVCKNKCPFFKGIENQAGQQQVLCFFPTLYKRNIIPVVDIDFKKKVGD